MVNLKKDWKKGLEQTRENLERDGYTVSDFQEDFGDTKALYTLGSGSVWDHDEGEVMLDEESLFESVEEVKDFGDCSREGLNTLRAIEITLGLSGSYFMLSSAFNDGVTQSLLTLGVGVCSVYGASRLNSARREASQMRETIENKGLEIDGNGDYSLELTDYSSIEPLIQEEELPEKYEIFGFGTDDPPVGNNYVSSNHQRVVKGKEF